MEKEEQISALIHQSERDFSAAESLFADGFYEQSLFWMHLSLEKLCKALWLKQNDEDSYPFIHNLVKLLSECGVSLTESQMVFYSDMNQFQARGRYPDFLHAIEETINKEVCENYIIIAKEQAKWLINHLQ